MSVTALAVLVNTEPAPVQVVAGASGDEDEEVAMTRLAGNVSVRLACVKSNGFGLVSVIVKVDAAFSPTLAGENDSLTAGAAAAKDKAVGQALVLLPALDGVVDAAVTPPLAFTDRIAVSTAPAESVTLSVIVPALPVDTTVACAVLAPDCTETPPLVVQA